MNEWKKGLRRPLWNKKMEFRDASTHSLSETLKVLGMWVERGYPCIRWSAEAVCNIIGATLLVLYIQMKLLQICGPLLMVIILKLPLCLYELQESVVYVDDCFLPQNVILPLSTSLHNGIHFFVISGILANCVRQCLTMICHWMPLLSNNFPNIIVRRIYLDLKCLLQDW